MVTASVNTMVFTDYTKRRIVYYHSQGLRPQEIADALEGEGISVSKSGVWKLLKRYKETGNTERRPGSGRRSIITDEIKKIIDDMMEKDDETTISQSATILQQSGHTISKATILRCRRELGWTFRRSAYCQLIREGNKAKRLAWAHLHLSEAIEGFRDVIFTDETSVVRSSPAFCIT